MKNWSVIKSTKIIPRFVRDVCEKRNIGKNRQLGKMGQSLQKYQIVKSDNTITKILYMNKIQLPDELIDIIKDYLYYSCDDLLYQRLLKNVNNSIKNIYREGQYIIGEDDYIYQCKINHYMYNERAFQQQSKLYERSIITTVCSVCGNYCDPDLLNDYRFSDSVLCCCADNIYYQQENEIQKFMVVNLSNKEIKEHF